ncbi:hypothetical protein [Winogradskyella bathintestinalis]|uniref:DUF4468 domain-containing protein n=1 Tax=Winogradskyella bathintestinalis TaxID=3035208 RepID=A0ABT7ZWV4_9FLAO|nr:hypothetical protein [Winogradskyella bathintestinalis]MDN3493454.1 hypothetical protein [Winogradskyella bathintestinalis]
MNYKYHIISIAIVCLGQLVMGQKLQQDEAEQLKNLLNTTLAPNFKLELKGDKAFCNIDELNKILDVKDSFQIAEDSLPMEAKKELYKGHYGGPVFWKYNFQTATNSDVLFKTNKYQQLFFTISFKDQDTIVIRSRLNAYTSYHRLSDSTPHIVNWTGDKYISLLLTPKKVDSKMVFQLKGITISGKFERHDKTDLEKKYIKDLQSIFKREFKTLFESEEMSQLISEKIKH